MVYSPPLRASEKVQNRVHTYTLQTLLHKLGPPVCAWGRATQLFQRRALLANGEHLELLFLVGEVVNHSVPLPSHVAALGQEGFSGIVQWAACAHLNEVRWHVALNVREHA